MMLRAAFAVAALMMFCAGHAEPYFAVQQGLRCAACHVSPGGGGLRNAFGNTWAQTVLPAQTIGTGADAGLWTGALHPRLAVGGNLRASASYLDVPEENGQSAFDLDELRLYLSIDAVPQRLSLYIDQRLAPGSGNNLEAYARFNWAEGRWYVRAGQMYLPYGWRLEDDTAFIRQVSGINFTTPDKGVELGLETASWSAQIAVSNGTAAGPETDEGKQFSLRAEHVRSRWRLGAGFNFNDADVGQRRMQGVFAGLLTGPIAWLAEADYVIDDSDPDERHQWLGLLEANWLVRRGHNLKLTTEFFDPDDDLDEDEQTRYSLVWEYTPIQFVQLKVGGRVYEGIPQNAQQNRRLYFISVNGFF